MKLIPDLRKFIELLNSASVRYLVIGGWAYNRYSEPRFTGDIDIFLGTDAETETGMRGVLEAFGFGDVIPQLPDSLFRKKVIMLGRPPHRIDLLTEITAVSFEEAWANKECGNLDGLDTYFLSLAD